MIHEEASSGEIPEFLARRPALQYLLLAAVGGLGVRLAFPLGLDPQSTVEWVDFMINVVILVPSAMLIGAGSTLAVLSVLTRSAFGEESRSARLATTVLRTIGIPKAVVPDVALLGPFGLLARIFWDKFREDSLPEATGSSDTEDA